MSSFNCLPPEMVQKCVEFLDFDLVSGDLKGVSKTTRKVARRALTRGRWKPIRYVAVQGLAIAASVGANKHAFIGTFGGSDPPPAAPSALFREAWALDAALVAHADDTLKIAEALKARGVDLAELDAMIK